MATDMESTHGKHTNSIVESFFRTQARQYRIFMKGKGNVMKQFQEKVGSALWFCRTYGLTPKALLIDDGLSNKMPHAEKKTAEEK